MTLVAHVARDERELEPSSGKRLHKRIALVGVPLRPDDRGSLRCQPHGDRAPDAAAAARHDRDLPSKAPRFHW
jgi:hypothetical protein